MGVRLRVRVEGIEFEVVVARTCAGSRPSRTHATSDRDIIHRPRRRRLLRGVALARRQETSTIHPPARRYASSGCLRKS